MKKNKMMRLASGLMVLTLLTTCTISGTFAKYTTQDDAMDQARVAKWGVVLQAVGNLYGVSYNASAKDEEGKETGNIIAAGAEGEILNLTVASKADITGGASTQDDVVAPGTRNENGLSFSLNGTPEVDYAISATIITENIFLAQGTYGVLVEANVDEANFATLKDQLYVMSQSQEENSSQEGNDSYVKVTENDTYNNENDYYTLEDEVTLTSGYYPVVYKMEGDTSDVSSITTEVSKDSLDAIAQVIAKQINGGTDVVSDSDGTEENGSVASDNDQEHKYVVEKKAYNNNTDIADLKLTAEKITWEWAFERGTTDADKAMYNGADTILGHLQASKGDSDNFKGIVVKGVANGENNISEYVAPTEDTEYCLDTKFEIDITVEQLD